MIRKTNIVEVQGLAGGRGVAQIHHIVPEQELYGHGRMYAKVVLRPGSSVGWHRHVGETEPYYILEGEGIFVDDDGSRTKVFPGDVCTIKPGQCHSIENASLIKNLVFMALIHKN
ncbi:MAG: cupin domain-containing protein [Eubacteriales bacterium]|nr:cupin domain-containing protein [Eubacteriales bacterium]